MDAWTPPPSPPLDTLSSSDDPSTTFLLACHVASTIPHRLWDAYVAYLWYYQPDSWVSRVASTFRILAAVLVLPVVLLTLLDVTSYVIARTLGIVDDVKASTSDADTITLEGGALAVPVPEPGPSSAIVYDTSHNVPGRTSECLRAPEDSVDRRTDVDADGEGHSTRAERAVDTVARPRTETRGQRQGRDACEMGDQTETRTARARSAGEEGGMGAVPRTYYFAGEADLRLAGEGVFSPAASMPPSPVTPRLPVHYAALESDGEVGQVSESEGVVLRRRVYGDKLAHA